MNGKESVFSSAIRVFFNCAFAVAGLIVGIFVIAMLLGGIFGESEASPEINYKYTPEVLPDASGVRKALKESAPVILNIKIQGVIGTELLNQATIRKQLMESREKTLKDGRVKAILLDISSPGGSSFDSDSIYHAIKNYKEDYKVPVYAYVNGLCASGAMYVACSADKIYASSGSLIGSVGVIVGSPFFNVSKLLDKFGVETLTLFAGKGKDDLSPVRPWKSGEQDNLQAAIDVLYEQFVDAVVQNRPKITREKLVETFGANIYPAPLAAEYGYIDESGKTYNQVLALLAKELSLEEGTYQVLELKDTSWWSSLVSSDFGFLKGVVKHKLELYPGLDDRVLSSPVLYLYH